MRLSAVLLLAAFALVVTGSGGQALKLLHIARGKAAAMILLLLAASAFEWRIGSADVGGGLVLLFGVCVYWVRDAKNATTALLAAGLSGMVAFLVDMARPTPAEGAFLPGVMAAFLAMAVLKDTRERVFSAVFSQILYSICRYLEEYCLFDTAILDLGKTAFDAAMLSLMLLLLLETALPQFRRLTGRGAGKDRYGKKCA